MEEEKELSGILGNIVRSSFLVFFSVILSKAFSYIYKIIIARNFGPEVYGLFSLGLVVIGIAGAIASFGVSDGILRYVSFYRGRKEYGKIKFITKKSMHFLFVTSIIITIIVFYLADFISISFFHDVNLSYYLKFLSLALPFSIIGGAMLAIIRGFEKITAYSFLVNFLHNFLKVILLCVAILIGLGHKGVLLSYVMAYLLLTFSTYFFIIKYIKKDYYLAKEITLSSKKEVTREFTSYSWPVVFSSILFNLFLWIDTIVLGSSGGGAQSVGIYGAAITLAGLFSFAQDLFIQLFVPLVSRNLSINNNKIIQEVSKQVFKWVFIINLGIALLLIIFPGTVLNLFFGSEYIGASQALRTLSIGAIFSGFLGLLIGLMNVAGKTKKMFGYYIIFSSINLFLDVLLVKYYGINGVAFGTAVTWILFTITLFRQVKKEYGFYPLRRAIIKVAFSGLTAGSLLWLVGKLVAPSISFMIISALSFGIVYILMIFLTKSLDFRDLEIIRKLKNKIFGDKDTNSL